MIPTKLTTLAALAVFAASSSGAPIAPPTNDNFANAIALASGTSTVDGTSATAQPGEPDHYTFGGARKATHSVWWKFTPTFSGFVQFDTKGSVYDTVLSVYTGPSLPSLHRVAQNDDSGAVGSPKTSLVTIAVTKGVTYHIAVDGFSGDVTGTTTLNLTILRINTPRTYQTALLGSPLQEDNGLLTLTTTTSSLVTGKLQLGAHAYSFAGAAAIDGHFLASINRPGQQPVLLDVTIGSNLDGAVFGPTTGTIKVGDNSLKITANPAALFTAAAPCPRQGRYVQAFANTGAVGAGVASYIVGATGTITTTGTLADGSAFAFSAPVLDDSGSANGAIGTGGSYCYHLPLYSSQGQITGTASFDATKTPTAVTGTMQWYRPAPAASVAFLPLGIEGSVVTSFGNQYTPPPPTKRVDTTFDNAPVGSSGAATLQIASLDFPSFTKSDLFLSTSNFFSYGASNPNLVKLQVSTDTGILTGSVKLVGATKLSLLKGVIINYPGYTTEFYGFATSTTGSSSLQLFANP